MNDLISRKAAIDVASGYCHPANIAKELAKLPSAQPEITENDVIEFCGKRCWVILTHDLYEEMIHRWSEIQPEIILCKECRHYGESLPDVDTRMICHKTALNYKPDDFCSYAERREDVDVKP